MKSRQLNYSRNIIILISLFLSLQAYSQDTYIAKRWNYKITYARYKIPHYNFSGKQAGTGNYRLEINYGVHKYIETGLYLGASKYELPSIVQDTTGIASYRTYITPLYGLSINFHLLPLIVDKEIRFDLYLTAKYGGYFFNTPKETVIYGHNAEYSAGTGLSFYPWRNFGLNVEFCFGNYLWEDQFTNDHTKFRYGLSLKF